MADHPAIEKCRNAVYVMGFTAPHFLLIHQRLRDLYRMSTKEQGVGTMAITSNGSILVNEDFVNKLTKEELQGVLAHEMLHLVLMHHGRRGGRDSWRWNVATDMAINHALRADDIKLPKDCLYPPHEYKGDIFAEAIYEWLKQNPQHMPQGKKCAKCAGKGAKGNNGGQGQGNGQGQGSGGNQQGQGSGGNQQGDDEECTCGKGQGDAGAGCGVLDEDARPDSPDWRQVAVEARAHAQNAGRGSSAVANLLSPRTPKIDWKKVIRHGFEVTASHPTRDYQTYAKRNRRSPEVGVQFPGWRGNMPSIGVIIDVSGSMDREWINQIVSETISLMNSFQGIKVFLATHTDQVTYADWLTQGQQWKLQDAVQFSGGTDPAPAYEAAEKANGGKFFDSIIHFTDCYFFSEWPRVPAKQLIVGSFVREIHTKPPAGAHVILCDPPNSR